MVGHVHANVVGEELHPAECNQSGLSLTASAAMITSGPCKLITLVGHSRHEFKILTGATGYFMDTPLHTYVAAAPIRLIASLDVTVNTVA